MARDGKVTAEMVALARAIGALERDSAVRNPDHLAAQFISKRARPALWPVLRRIAVAATDRRQPGLYYYVQVRTRHLDRLLHDALAVRPDQFVVLGAGLDSRCYRFAQELEGVACFEVDHPGTAAWKRRRLARWGGPTQHVRYVTIDFTREALAERLAAHGFRFELRTVWLWEGVSYYLPEAAVRDTLALVAKTTTGSRLLFDYMPADTLTHPERYYGAVPDLAYLASEGEPMLFGIEPARLAEFLAPYGLRVIDDASAAELAKRHLVRSDGRPIGRTAEFFRIAQAERVPAQEP
jgi:methyltransferase (TIGR00027 family)